MLIPATFGWNYETRLHESEVVITQLQGIWFWYQQHQITPYLRKVFLWFWMFWHFSLFGAFMISGTLFQKVDCQELILIFIYATCVIKELLKQWISICLIQVLDKNSTRYEVPVSKGFSKDTGPTEEVMYHYSYMKDPFSIQVFAQRGKRNVTM